MAASRHDATPKSEPVAHHVRGLNYIDLRSLDHYLPHRKPGAFPGAAMEVVEVQTTLWQFSTSTGTRSPRAGRTAAALLTDPQRTEGKTALGFDGTRGSSPPAEKAPMPAPTELLEDAYCCRPLLQRLSRVSWNLSGGPPPDTARGVGVGHPPRHHQEGDHHD